MTKTEKSLCCVAVGLLAAAIALPCWIFPDLWFTSNAPGTGLLKTVELLILIGFFGVIAAIGGVKITSSDAASMEWLGTVLVLFGGIALGMLFLMSKADIDEYASYRYLVSQRGNPSVPMEADMEMDWDTGKLKYKVDYAHLWIAINVDYYDNDPLPRKSFVLFTYEADSEGYGEIQIPTHENVKRVGVFFGTGNGPSGDQFEFDPLMAEKEAAKKAAQAQQVVASSGAGA
jgi:hypothetical protein